MSTLIRSAAALLLSVSLASFGAGCITEESFEDEEMEEMEEMEAELADAERTKEELEAALERAIELELIRELPPAVRLERPGTTSKSFTARRVATEAPEVAEGMVDPHPYRDAKLIDTSVELRELTTSEIPDWEELVFARMATPDGEQIVVFRTVRAAVPQLAEKIVDQLEEPKHRFLDANFTDEGRVDLEQLVAPETFEIAGR